MYSQKKFSYERIFTARSIFCNVLHCFYHHVLYCVLYCVSIFYMILQHGFYAYESAGPCLYHLAICFLLAATMHTKFSFDA